MGRKFGIGSIATVAVGAIVYTYGLLVLYLFRFGEYEAVRLASYERYLGTYWAGVALFVALVVIWLVGSSYPSEPSVGTLAKTEGVTELVVAGVLTIALLVLSPVQKLAEFFANPNGYSAQIRSQFEPVLEQARTAGIKPGDRVWIISQHTSGFEYWVLRYSLMENETNSATWSLGSKGDDNDVWTVSKSASEWAQELTDYDYVLIFRATDSFVSEFGNLFANPTDATSSSVFKVENIEGSIFLEKAR
jgi:hypothetical protein